MNDHHNESHTVASHSDTSGTGAELNTLTDDSMADSLHRHSELSASDGSPNPALVVDAAGEIGIGLAAPAERFHILDSAAPNIRLDDDGNAAACELQGYSNRDSADQGLIQMRGYWDGTEVGLIGIKTGTPCTSCHLLIFHNWNQLITQFC